MDYNVHVLKLEELERLEKVVDYNVHVQELEEELLAEEVVAQEGPCKLDSQRQLP